jgi:hypothetical protein
MFESRRWLLAGIASIQFVLSLSSAACAQTTAINESINGKGPKFIIVEPGKLLPDGKVMTSDSRIAYIAGDGYFVPKLGHRLIWGKIPPHYFDSLYEQNKLEQVSSKKDSQL